MSRRASVLPDDGVFSDFRKQCLATENWHKKYDKNDMQVWVEFVPKQQQVIKSASKIHKIKVSLLCTLHFKENGQS